MAGSSFTQLTLEDTQWVNFTIDRGGGFRHFRQIGSVWFFFRWTGHGRYQLHQLTLEDTQWANITTDGGKQALLFELVIENRLYSGFLIPRLGGKESRSSADSFIHWAWILIQTVPVETMVTIGYHAPDHKSGLFHSPSSFGVRVQQFSSVWVLLMGPMVYG